MSFVLVKPLSLSCYYFPATKTQSHEGITKNYDMNNSECAG